MQCFTALVEGSKGKSTANPGPQLLQTYSEAQQRLACRRTLHTIRPWWRGNCPSLLQERRDHK
jgi:hypothetical protein